MRIVKATDRSIEPFCELGLRKNWVRPVRWISTVSKTFIKKKLARWGVTNCSFFEPPAGSELNGWKFVIIFICKDEIEILGGWKNFYDATSLNGKNGKLRRYISKRGLLWKCRKDVVGRIIYEAVKILIRRVYPGRIGSFVKGVATEGNAVVINFITTNFPHGTFL